MMHVRVAARRFGVSLVLIAVAPVDAADWVYTVRPGDNLWSLSARYLTAIVYWRKLQAINRIADPWHIPPGTRLHIPVPWLREHPVLARIVDVHGKVDVVDDGPGNAKPATGGAYLVLGDSLRTGPDGNVVVEFTDGSRILLQGDSDLRLDQLGRYGETGMTDTRLRLERGRIETQAAPQDEAADRFEISTPAAVTSVRGTDYRVGAERARPESRAEVLAGEVAVRSGGGARSVGAGFGTVALPDRPPLPPVPLLPPPGLGDLPKIFDRLPLRVDASPVTGARAYRLQISRADDVSRMVYDRRFESLPLRGPDLPDGTYTIRVRGIDERGLEGANAERRIELNARPEPPFPIEPKPEAGVTEDQPAFLWSRRSSITRYRVQVARDRGFARPVLDARGVGDTRWVADRGLPLGRFFWRVASIDAVEGDGPFSDPQEFRRVMPAPEIAEPDIDDAFLLVRWRAGSPGQRYQVQWARDDRFAAPLIDARSAEPMLRIARPEPGEYFIRVRTIEIDGFVGPFGAPQQVDVPDGDLYWWLLMLPLFGLLAL